MKGQSMDGPKGVLKNGRCVTWMYGESIGWDVLVHGNAEVSVALLQRKSHRSVDDPHHWHHEREADARAFPTQHWHEAFSSPAQGLALEGCITYMCSRHSAIVGSRHSLASEATISPTTALKVMCGLAICLILRL